MNSTGGYFFRNEAACFIAVFCVTSIKKQQKNNNYMFEVGEKKGELGACVTFTCSFFRTRFNSSGCFFFFLIPHFAELPYFFFFYRTKKKKMSFLNVNNNLFLKVILLG